MRNPTTLILKLDPGAHPLVANECAVASKPLRKFVSGGPIPNSAIDATTHFLENLQELFAIIFCKGS
jgi:hypothetical protein